MTHDKLTEIDQLRLRVENDLSPPCLATLLYEIDDLAAEAIRLKAENEKAKEMLSKATTFTLQHRGQYVGEPTETIMVEQRDECRWAVTNGREVLNAEGEWEHEPSPSSRTDEFKDRTRFSLDEAFVRARAFIKEKTDE